MGEALPMLSLAGKGPEAGPAWGRLPRQLVLMYLQVLKAQGAWEQAIMTVFISHVWFTALHRPSPSINSLTCSLQGGPLLPASTAARGPP